MDRHRLRHILSRALGSQGDTVAVDVTRVGLRDGDQLLLCTDGLTGMVSEDAIRDLLAAGGTAESACRALIDAALAAGGKDNVTVALARYRFPGEL